MNKLYEKISNKKGAKFMIDNTELQYDRFSMYYSDKVIKNHGISIEEFNKKMENDTLGIGLDLAYEVLTEESKSQFGNSILTFKKCIGTTTEYIEATLNALALTMEEALPKKKPQMKRTQKKK